MPFSQKTQGIFTKMKDASLKLVIFAYHPAKILLCYMNINAMKRYVLQANFQLLILMEMPFATLVNPHALNAKFIICAIYANKSTFIKAQLDSV